MVDSWSFRPARAEDTAWLAELKLAAMRADLRRLGRWNPERVRRRFLDEFVPANTRIVVVDGAEAGAIAVRPEAEEQWIEHFYLHPWARGRGLGGRVLAHVLETHRDHRPFRLVVVRGSPARRLYERHGFVHQYDHDNGVDQVLTTVPSRQPLGHG
ncbi:GNAT family N-acetyltransferase [Actinopolyspora mortivallis]|uniref:GNAT family N-acetyltransferase n=1 Tax=Actinopolyspora mortivallis TaxID=33906 RepID=A0A2T0GTQ6_ACTMO|nr:GNAT family N-acetyltransferase [Actinopolyspora mortivallis]PRW62506.1 GNAT family N-acetyltransferase [Actinopolyspora mortivallis]